MSATASDAHTWNLVFLQLFLEELGYSVVNLGSCVSDERLVRECLRIAPTLIVISSVNGHGCQDGLRLIGRLRSEDRLKDTPTIIGGKLGITGTPLGDRVAELLEGGFDAVFDDGARDGIEFHEFLRTLPERQTRLPIEASLTP